ncbi:MAG: DUF2945 domain-containing protein [Pseudomonadota bacterium]
MSKTLRVGQYVEWPWGEGTARGKIVKRYEQKVTLDIKGTSVTRNASQEEPAFMIRQDDGDCVLKAASEIESS